MEFVVTTLSSYVLSFKRFTSHRSYKRLLLGGFVSGLGDRISYLAFLAAVASKTDDAMAIGGLTISEMLPGIVALPFVSYIVDRFDKRRLLFASDIFRAVVFLLAAMSGEIWMFFACGFISSCFTMLFEPARMALEPHYIPEGEILQANGTRQSMMSLVMVIGPALGGVLVATVGFRTAFIVNSITFLVSAWLVRGLDRIPLNLNKRTDGFWKEITGGMAAVRSSHVLMYLFALMAFFNLAIGIQFPLMFVFIKENLGGSATTTGWLFSAIGVGGILAGAILASIPKTRTPFEVTSTSGRRKIAALAAIDGVVVIAFASLHSIPPVLIIFALFGAIGVCLMVAYNTAVTEQTHEAVRGRVFSLYHAIQGPLLVISIAIGTPLARKYGAANVFYASGGLEVLLGTVAFLLAGKIKQKVLLISSR